MKNICITTRHALSPEKKAELFSLLRFLKAQEKNIICTDRSQKFLKNSSEFSATPLLKNFADIDLFIFFGGDGTILKSIHLFAPEILSVPIFGINAGNIGFFSSTTLQDAKENLQKIFSGKYTTDKRMVLEGKIISAEGEVKHSFYALNEAVIHHSGVARLRHISAMASGKELTKYHCDGLIISTPTGSTAYNLSAGGPVVSPVLETILLTPIAPSGFSQRPIVLPSNASLEFSVDSSMLLSVDGQKYFSIDQSDTISVMKHDSSLSFLRLEDEHYFTTLREKLGWGK